MFCPFCGIGLVGSEVPRCVSCGFTSPVARKPTCFSRGMNKRQTALEIVRSEVAKTGEITKEALRQRVESRISYNAWQDAVKRGYNQFLKIKGDGDKK